MKLKLDENLGERDRQILLQAEHDVSTASDQEMAGATDEELIRRCPMEGRALVTLDSDFANPLRFRPSQHAGIAVRRLPTKAFLVDLEILIHTPALGLATSPKSYDSPWACWKDGCGLLNQVESPFTKSVVMKKPKRIRGSRNRMDRCDL